VNISKKNMAMAPEIKNDCAGEVQQQFAGLEFSCESVASQEERENGSKGISLSRAAT
jgi:hypothetical protein